MNQSSHTQWVQSNQQYLAARLHDVVQALQDNEEPFNHAIDFSASDAIAQEMISLPALNFISEAFALSPFEQFTLLLCAGYEFDGNFANTMQQLDPLSAPKPSFDFAMRLFVDSHWSAITPVAPLRHWRLLELENGTSVVTSPLRIDERILHFLSGISYLDTRLKGMIRYESSLPKLAPSLEACVEKIVVCCRSAEQDRALPVIQVCGQRNSDMKSVVLNACQNLELIPYHLDVEDIPRENGEREALLRLWQRESILDRTALIISSKSEHESLLNGFVRDLYFPCFVIDQQPVDLATRSSIRIDVPMSNSAEQISLWNDALGEKSKYINGGLNRLVSQFNLTAQNIAEVGRQVSVDDTKESELEKNLWQHCRLQSRKRLDSLAQRVESETLWDDLVLPPAQKQTLRDVIAQTRQRFKVYEEWGFNKKSAAGQGISAIFYGASGTGKTMAACAIANELQLDLYRIDLSQVVNKYIGETEKNLAKVFDAAEDSGAILLFDEADSLFAKRTEVKSSHDRNANLETSYLLQRMESYCGLAILTTNLKKDMDSAFMRRIRFALQFPFPDLATREQIWQRMFPEQTPLNNIDIRKLASLDVAGGNIRNIALNAAFLAADENQAITMLHLAKAARRELGKIEKSIKESELRRWL